MGLEQVRQAEGCSTMTFFSIPRFVRFAGGGEEEEAEAEDDLRGFAVVGGSELNSKDLGAR